MILDEIDRVPAVPLMKPFGFAWRRVPWLKKVFAWSQKCRRLHDKLGSYVAFSVAVCSIALCAFDHRLECLAFLDARVSRLDCPRPRLATAALRVDGLERFKIEFLVRPRSVGTRHRSCSTA